MAEVPNLVISVNPEPGGEVDVSYSDINESLDYGNETVDSLNRSDEDEPDIDRKTTKEAKEPTVKVIVDMEKPITGNKRYLNPDISENNNADEESRKPTGFFPLFSEDTIRMLYQEFGIDHESYRDKMRYRLNCIHLRGVNDMITEDVFQYFKAYKPLEVEWVSDYSCNVIWPDNQSSASAMLAMSKLMQTLPFHKRSAFENEAVDANEIPLGNRSGSGLGKESEIVAGNIAGGSGGDDSDDENISPLKRAKTGKGTLPAPDKMDEASDFAVKDSETEKNSVSSRSKDVKKRKSLEADEEMESEDDSSGVELRFVDPSKHAVPPGVWRVGDSYPKSPLLLLRFATRDDVKLPGAHSRSDFYKKHGNPNLGNLKGLISNSRKRKIKKSRSDSHQILASFLSDDRSMNSEEDDLSDGEIKESVPADLRARLSANRARGVGGVHDRLGPMIVVEEDEDSGEDDQSVVVGYDDNPASEQEEEGVSYVVESEEDEVEGDVTRNRSNESSDSEFDIDKYMPDETNAQMTMRADEEQRDALERPYRISEPKFRPVVPVPVVQISSRLQGRLGLPNSSNRKGGPPEVGDLRRTLTKWREEDDGDRWGNREVYDIR